MEQSVGQDGLSLIELLIVLATAAVLVSLGLSDWSQLIRTHKADKLSIELKELFTFARNQAVDQNTFFTLCPSFDGIQCDKGATQKWIVFSDHNRNKSLDGNDILVKATQLDLSDFELKVLPSNRGYFRYQALGITHGTPGSIIICHDDEKSIRKLTLSMLGRLKESRDTNGDGIHENSSGQNPNCS